MRAVCFLILCLSGCKAETECANYFTRDAQGNCVLDVAESSTTPPDETSTSTPDDTEPQDTEPDDTEPQDSGSTTDTAPPVPEVFVEGPEVVCEDPAQREVLGPLYLAELGEDWTQQEYGSLLATLTGAGLTVADLTGDGLMDIVLSHRRADQLFIQQPSGEMVDETAERWPLISSDTASARAVDVEGDGDLDLYLCNLEGPDHLFLNDGTGIFTDATEASGLADLDRMCTGSAWGDMDGDGDLDLFVTNYARCDFADGEERCTEDRETLEPRALWENQGDGTFLDVSDRLPREALINAFMFQAAWTDIDQDGDQDLYIVNDYRYEFEWAHANSLFKNDGSGHFRDISEETYTDIAVAAMGLNIGDINVDGLPDLLISDIGKFVFLRSIDDTWVDVAQSQGLYLAADEGRWASWGAQLADLDNDGDLDVPAGFGPIATTVDGEDVDGSEPQKQTDSLFIQDADGHFVEASEDWGLVEVHNTRSVAAVDVNHDGWLDLLWGSLDAPASLYLSRCDASAWLTVNLRDDSINPFGIGARVRVEVDGVAQHRWIQASGTGLHTSLQPIAHFGLGDAESVTALEVLWPDGEVMRFEDVGVRREVTITRR